MTTTTAEAMTQATTVATGIATGTDPIAGGTRSTLKTRTGIADEEIAIGTAMTTDAGTGILRGQEAGAEAGTGKGTGRPTRGDAETMMGGEAIRATGAGGTARPGSDMTRGGAVIRRMRWPSGIAPPAAARGLLLPRGDGSGPKRLREAAGSVAVELMAAPPRSPNTVSLTTMRDEQTLAHQISFTQSMHSTLPLAP